MGLTDLAVAALMAAVLVYGAIRIVVLAAPHIGLIDVPDQRKRHQGRVPVVGGIGIFIGVALAACWLAGWHHDLSFFLTAALLLVIVGMVDDARDLGVRSRLLAQFVAAAIMVVGAELSIRGLGSLIGTGPIELGWLAFPFTVLAVVGAINAFNMIDGIDGLAGSLAIVTAASIGLLLCLAGGVQGSWLAWLVVAALCSFLVFNFKLHGSGGIKVFMGDAGSMFIGFTLIWLMVQGSQGEGPAFRPVTCLWLCAVPLMDMAAIMIRRIQKGQSPFQADRDHLHHIFMRLGCSSRQTLAIIVAVAVAFAAVGIVGELLQLAEWVMLLGFLLLFTAYHFALRHIWLITTLLRSQGRD